MIRVIILLYLLANARAERKTVYMHMTKNSGNTQPIQNRYVYSQRNKGPAKMITIDNLEQIGGEFNTPLFGGKKRCNFESKIIMTMCKLQESRIPDEKITKRESNSENDANNYPQNVEASEMKNVYSDIGFQVDAEDLRTDTGNLYDDWRYLYNKPYDYQGTAFGADFIKPNYLYPNERVIPVYEHAEDYQHPNSYVTPNQIYPTPSSMHSSEITTENLVLGDQPFFSYVLNDYFDKFADEDSLTFKDLSWETRKHFITDPSNDVEVKRIRRLDNSYGNIGTTNSVPIYLQNNKNHIISNNNHEFRNQQKANEVKNNEEIKSKHASEKYKGFKDFLDSFANKYGAEDHDKKSKYKLEMNSDKGEKKNGFRRVYHKDEYQEDNEFFDNTNNKTATEQNGMSKVRTGGSEAYLQSQVAAELGDENDLFSKNKNHMTRDFERNNAGIGSADDFKRYIDIAKHTDYINPMSYRHRFLK